MTLKEELEILRDEPIEVFDGDPMDIPCIETSDAEKLCKHPVVSVQMCTYNHEPYIRQAIEGVMMQKTDFEFELVIGEDCSQDKTREICFEYQKKYPDKIRILWWHENVSKFGGNSRRVTVHCRGEFIAFCEGDDYWIDPLKLQKQVDAMRKHANVGLCFSNANILDESSHSETLWETDAYNEGVISGREFLSIHSFGKNSNKAIGTEGFIMTASVVVRAKVLRQACYCFDIFKWRLAIGDSIIWKGVASLSDMFYLKDVLSIYRKTTTGAMRTLGFRISRDATIVSLYYHIKAGNHSFAGLSNSYRSNLMCLLIASYHGDKNIAMGHVERITTDGFLKPLFEPFKVKVIIYLIRHFPFDERMARWYKRFLVHFPCI